MSINTDKKQEESLEHRVRTGAEIFVDTVNDLGIEHLFGHTGGAIMPMYVELNKRLKKNEKTPEIIMFRHEAGAGHAAEGYAKSRGIPALVCVTSGPGATNLVTPIADAYADSIPMICVTGQVPSNFIGTDAFQEVPITQISSQILKYAVLIKDPKNIEKELRRAYELATTGRKGPVLIDICKDAFGEKPNETNNLEKKDRLGKTNIDEMLLEFSKAKKPLLYVGGGIKASDSVELLRKFSHEYDTPVGMTLMSLGTVPRNERLSLGMLGMHGTIEANYAALESDFILAIGTRFDDRVAVSDFGLKAMLAQVDIDKSEINKIKHLDHHVNMDAKRFLEYALKHSPKRLDELRSWHEQIDEWRELNPKIEESDDEIIPQRFIKELSDLTSGGAVVATGVGQHQMWTAQYYNFLDPSNLLTSGGLGTMGYGLPAIIGAYFSKPKKSLILIDGDGSFQMNMQELATVMAYNMPIKMFIINNGLWGLPMQWHKLFDNGNLFECCLERTSRCLKDCSSLKNCRNYNPDFVGLSSVYHGLKTRRISTPEEIRPAIIEAMTHDGPYLLDVRVKRESYIWPIIPPAKGISDIRTQK